MILAGSDHWAGGQTAEEGGMGFNYIYNPKYMLPLREVRTQLAIWAIVGAPLLLSADLRKLSPQSATYFQQYEGMEEVGSDSDTKLDVVSMATDYHYNVRGGASEDEETARLGGRVLIPHLEKANAYRHLMQNRAMLAVSQDLLNVRGGCRVGCDGKELMQLWVIY